MTTGADGWGSKLLIQEALPFAGTATCLEFTSESLARTSSIMNTQGFSGTRSQHGEKSRFGTSAIAGQITIPWSPTAGVTLLPLILGGTPTGTSFPLADTLPAWQYQIDRVTKVFNYTDVTVNKGTWKGTSGGMVDCVLDLIGTDEVIVAAAGGQAFTLVLDPPYVFSDLTISVGGATRSIFDFELTVDNKLAARYANSRTPTRIAPADLREVSISFTTPFGSTEYDQYNSALAGSAVVLTATNGNYSTVWTMAAVQFPAMSPVIPGKGEIPLKMTGIARMTSTTRELVVTHDSTG